MNEDFYISLVYKQLQGELSSKEKLELDKWAAKSTDNQQLVDDIKAVYELSGGYLETTGQEIDVNQAFEEQQQLLQPTAKIRKIRPIYNWQNWAAAAAVLVVAVVVLIVGIAVISTVIK